MKKKIGFIGLIFLLFSCVTYKYSKEQYDWAMNNWLLGKNINFILDGCPFKVQVGSDGKGGNIYNLDLSANVTLPAYSSSNSYSNINVSPGYNSLNIQNRKTTTTYSYPERNFSTDEFINLWVDKEGTVYLVNYKLSPNKLNSTYEKIKNNTGFK